MYLAPFKYLSFYRYCLSNLLALDLKGRVFHCATPEQLAADPSQVSICMPTGDLYLQSQVRARVCVCLSVRVHPPPACSQPVSLTKKHTTEHQPGRRVEEHWHSQPDGTLLPGARLPLPALLEEEDLEKRKALLLYT